MSAGSASPPNQNVRRAGNIPRLNARSARQNRANEGVDIQNVAPDVARAANSSRGVSR